MYLKPKVPAVRAAARGCCVLAGVVLLFVVRGELIAVARAQGTGGSDYARQWALLIGAEQYQKAPKLRYTVNDVQQISATLMERGGVAAAQIREIVDTASTPENRPLRASIMQAMPSFLSQIGAEDSLLVYFSGHGFRDAEGKMYLAPLDCDPANPAPTGIAVEWFREQLASCPAKFKLLVLDSCHAGSEKGDEEAVGVTSKDLGEPFRDLTGVVTLASSTADEKSQLWSEKQQSLFSYWLNQALKGHADIDGDGAIDIDELNRYVYQNVTHTAKVRFAMPQTPVRIIRSGTFGVPVVLRLAPMSLKQVVSDMAEQLAWAMQERGLEKVGVLEFTNDTKLGELLGADFGLLGRYCAEQLERQLTMLSANHYSVVDRRRLETALKGSHFGIEQLGSPDAMTRLASNVGGLPVIALGTLRNRAGRVVNLQCKLVRTSDSELASSVGGTVWLSENEWAMLGKSVAVKPTDMPPPMPGAEQPGSGRLDKLIERLDQRAEGPHPLRDPNFSFRVRLLFDGKERKPVFQGNEAYIPVRKNETFQIEIENVSGQKVCMRLLVDGLNTLPEKVSTKGIETYEVAPRVSLDEARHWILDPAKASRFVIAGFVTETGVQGKMLEFKVVDVAESFAGRKSFTDQVGMITAAFYAATSARGDLAIGGGAEVTASLDPIKDVKCGNLLGVVHLRYVNADTFTVTSP